MHMHAPAVSSRRHRDNHGEMENDEKMEAIVDADASIAGGTALASGRRNVRLTNDGGAMRVRASILTSC